MTGTRPTSTHPPRIPLNARPPTPPPPPLHAWEAGGGVGRDAKKATEDTPPSPESMRLAKLQP